MTMFGLRKCSGQVRAYTGVPGVTGTPRGVKWALWALVEKRRERRKGGRPPLLVQFGPGGRGTRPISGHLSSLPLRPTKAHIPPGGFRQPPRAPVLSQSHPEPFRCPNIVIEYINLYVSTISRLLVMSVITSGTPNNLRYIKNS